ncbi:hypothetical protein [Pleionea sediminis]|uniref:hypothetical protein n=1 Tax=Pleionea sediminis TaxID=2569479 RepID=UPI001185C0AB|nr:hypothetical protein [Pleionea sediminis]
MLQIIISAALLVGIFKLFDAKNQKEDLAEIDVWVGAAAVAIPAVIVFVVNSIVLIDVMLLNIAITYSIYFLAPFLYFRFLMEFPWKMASLYAFFVPLVVAIVEVLFFVILKSFKSV